MVAAESCERQGLDPKAPATRRHVLEGVPQMPLERLEVDDQVFNVTDGAWEGDDAGILCWIKPRR